MKCCKYVLLVNVIDSADKKLASFAGPVSDVGKELYVVECPRYIFFSLLLMKKPNKLALIPEKTSEWE